MPTQCTAHLLCRAQDRVRIKFPQYKHYQSYATFAEPLFRECEALKQYLVRTRVVGWGAGAGGGRAGKDGGAV